VPDGHLYVLETPLCACATRRKTIYCYSEAERDKSHIELGGKQKSHGSNDWAKSPAEFKQSSQRNAREQSGITRRNRSQRHLTFSMGQEQRRNGKD